MKIVLTGVTGNLGHEVLLCFLKKNKVEIIPVVREDSLAKISPYRDRFKTVILNDLLDDREIETLDGVDCIVHCAGIVDFYKSGDSNQKMMAKIIRFADKVKSSVFFVSTAFVYKPEGSTSFNNSYEEDKFKSEQLLVNSKLKYSIIRPSVIVGNSKSGQIDNVSGYYSIVKSFLDVIYNLKQQGKKLRLPKYEGFSNIIPVDYVACGIVNTVLNKEFGIFYMVNPNILRTDDLLKQTLSFFHLSDSVELVDMDYDNLVKLTDLTKEEIYFYKFNLHFKSYWSIDYTFPKSYFEKVASSEEFLPIILSYFSNIQNRNI